MGNRVNCLARLTDTKPKRISAWDSELRSLEKRQPAADPTLVLVQQFGRFHLGQAVLTHQCLHQPGFFQFVRPAADAVEPIDRRLGRTLVDLHQTHTQGGPADARRRRTPFETVEQFNLSVV